MIQQRLIQLSTPVERTLLSDSAWIDIGQRWWDADGELLDRLVRRCAWRAERRRMYDRVVEVPRLVAFYGADDPLPDPVLYEMRAQLNDRYAADLGEPLVSAGLCWYRDGRDSVAWHGDTLGRGRHEDTVVAIVSIGAERTFALRPHRGGAARRLLLGDGDLLVMGGSCQRTWDHAVPKSSRAVGPRVSVQFRAAGVR